MLWRAIGASVPGTQHIEKGRGCDDAHGWTSAGDITILAVADGAGSRPGTSALGAHFAVASVLEAASGREDFATKYEADPRRSMLAIFQAAIDALHSHAADRETTVDSLATTLSVAVLGSGTITVAQIGDGIATLGFLGFENGDLKTVAVGDRFEYANVTVFVTAPNALEHLKICSVPAESVKSIALSTDGLKYKLLEDVQASVPYSDFYQDSWAYARVDDAGSEPIAAFLRSVDDQTGDDKTLVLAVRDYAGRPGEPERITDKPQSAACGGGQREPATESQHSKS